VCVLYHDNYVVVGDETNPTSMLIKDMELEEFKGASPVNSVVGGSSDDGVEGHGSDDEALSMFYPALGGVDAGARAGRSRRSIAGSSPESSSVNLGGSPESSKLLRQLHNGIVASASDKSLHAWTCVEDEEFPTLLEVFERMPGHVAFDIEIKMTTAHDVVKTPEDELVRMVDTILRTVDVAEARARERGEMKRPLLFSSFDPDVCALVRQRRPDDWVMFLSTGGTSYHADPRRMSVDAAIEVAVLNGLQGIILDSGCLFRDQNAVLRARSEGLLTMTYGDDNDDVHWVGLQKALGVYGVIVDNVERVSAAFLA